jgi:F-type H+-transporting ATPase subunit gamma
MESVQNLKKRIKSIGNIKKITKAMELVAATKMRKAQETALASRPYAFAALDLLANLELIAKGKKEELPELLHQRTIKKVLFVVVASDKGLAGAFNSALFRKFEQHMERDREKYQGEEKFFMAVGEKSFQYLTKKGLSVVQRFVEAGEHATLEDVHPITDVIVKGYLEKKWDRVVVVSTHFRSALKQEPHIRKVLPIDFDDIKETIEEIIPHTGKFAELIKEEQLDFHGTTAAKDGYLIEPSPKIVLENLARHLLFVQMYHLVLEANASEHAARRMAMKTASDNASDLGDDLNLQYNKSRQAAITNQIIEIIAGAESLN